MPNVKTYNFGPGSLEGMTLSTWVSKREGDLKRVSARLTGTYTVYCGMGWDHQIEIAEKTSGWNTEQHAEAVMIVALHSGSDKETELKHEVAELLVDYALEDFEDPCEDNYDYEEAGE